MQRSSAIAGALALIALVQAVSCSSAASRIDALAQKLEDHYHNKNLNNEITLAECLATFDEFAAVNMDDYKMNDQPTPLLKVRVFLDSFMYAHFKLFPEKLKKLQDDQEAAKEFIKTLETAYKRFRPFYNYEYSIYDAPSVGESIKIVTKHLDGDSDQPPTPEQMKEAMSELGHITNQFLELFNRAQNIYETQDEMESMLRVWATPEISSWTKVVLPLFEDEAIKEKYLAGDEATVKEIQRVYQNGVAEVIYNLRSDFLCSECRADSKPTWFGGHFMKKLKKITKKTKSPK